MAAFLSSLVAGLAVGSVYGMIAICYTVVFSATRVFNVAQGDIVAAGVLLAWLLLDQAHLPQVAALLLTVAAVAAVSVVEERLLVRRFLTRGSGHATGMSVFICTLAFTIILENINSNIYGTRPLSNIPSIAGQQAIRIGSVNVSRQFLLAFGALIIVTLGLELFYKRSWLGTAMRACAEDRAVAALRGIDPARVSQYAFLIAGIIAGLTGFILAPIVNADVTVGLMYGLKGFIALAVGGFGSIRGSLVGACGLGIAEQMLDLYGNSNYEILAGLGLLLLVLSIRPAGLFGVRAERVV